MNNLARLEPEVLSRHAISAEQLGIWYIQRLEPTCSAYNMVVAFDVKVNQPLGNKPIEILEAVMHDYPLLRVSMPANDQELSNSSGIACTRISSFLMLVILKLLI